MKDKVIYDGAIQIPIAGPIFKVLNLCIIKTSNQICLNLQTDDDRSNDQPYFLSLDDSKDLRDDLINSINELEEETK